MQNFIFIYGEYAGVITKSGEEILCDTSDIPKIMHYTWKVTRRRAGATGYALARKGNNTSVYLHRVLLDAPKGLEVDHINRNGLDNRRSNIRLATTLQNHWTRGANRTNASGLKGVRLHRIKGLWAAVLAVNGREKRLGIFECKYEAAYAYNEAAKRIQGEFAYQNPLPESFMPDPRQTTHAKK
jgi:hypothetical protein